MLIAFHFQFNFAVALQSHCLIRLAVVFYVDARVVCDFLELIVNVYDLLMSSTLRNYCALLLVQYVC